MDLTARASEYPKYQVFRAVHPYLLDFYFEQLNKLDERLFHGMDRASVSFWECFGGELAFEEAVLTNRMDLKKQLRLTTESSLKHEPRCSFMFVEATSVQKLRITREMLTLILSYHQVLPNFLEFIFPFARDLHSSDFHFGGFRSHVRFSAADKGLFIPDRGWSGQDLKVCYNLKSAEHDDRVSSNEWPWYMDQSAVHHSFDVKTGQASWIVIKGDARIKHRIKSATSDKSLSRFSFHTQEQAFTSTLEVHLIFCEWSGQTWRWYVNFLDKEIQSSTSAAVFSSLEAPVSWPQNARATNIRQRHGKQVNKTTPAAVTNRVQGLSNREGVESGPSVGERATPIIPSPMLPTSDDQPTKDAGLSFSKLQGAHAIEELVNDANLLLKVNQNVLTELKETYKSFQGSPDWPTNLSSNCRGDLTRFDQRITNIQNDMAIQQSRVEKLLRFIADRKSLLYGILDQQNIQMGKQQAEQAQRSAWRMEEMTSTVHDLTKDMHVIARETREETISMRIMALIALLFLPGSFASTLMSTKIFQASDDKEYHRALGQFFAMFLPLLFATTLLWYLAKRWHTFTEDVSTKHAKET